MATWVLACFAVWMVGQMFYELLSGTIVFSLGSFNVTREEQPKKYWICFSMTFALTVLACYLAYQTAFPNHRGN
jgi:hypothetical protein